MNYTTLAKIVALQLCVATPVHADASVNATKSLSGQRALSRADVGGLVMGQTVTLGGRAFYDSFAAAWGEMDEAGRFTVSVVERPTARLGSQVFVNYGNRRMLQMFLPPNRTQIPAIGAEAAAQVFKSILDYQIAQFFGDPDMGRDEF
jgi:curli production assembly/transport component CsgE